jgi:hypothetical protein
MKSTKGKIDDFKRNEISKNKCRKIIGGNNIEDNTKRNLASSPIDPIDPIDPPVILKPPGQV